MSRGTLVLLFVTGGALAAQQRTDSIAMAGPAGVYIWLGGTVVSAAHPVDGIVAYRVERRRDGGGEDWNRVADVAAVRDARALFAPLDSATRTAVRSALHAKNDADAWERIVRFPRADSLAILLGHETLRLALGFYALDRAVKPGERWQYRVSRLDAEGRATASVVSAPVSFPGAALGDSIHLLRTADRETGGLLWWQLEPRSAVRWVEIWRRSGTTGPFTRIDSVAAFLRAGDSLLVAYRDAGQPAGGVFQYYALPRDFFFNPGPASDTATIYTVDERRLAVPDSLTARGDSAAGGVALAWRLPTIGLARTIRVWRSARQDSGWYHLAELPGDARRFLDDRVAPMTRYYYRLTVLGVRGHESPPTGAVFAHFRSTLAPEPPSLVRVDTVGRAGNLRVTWTPNRESDIKGYYVSRTDAAPDSAGVDAAFTLVSPLVPSGESTYVDTAASAVTGRQWRFAVQAVSTSDRVSGYSAPATAPAEASLAWLSPLPVPSGLRAFVRERRVRLVWDAIAGLVPGATGYEVMRRGDGTDSVWHSLAATLALGDNAMWDSTVVLGRRYEYAVRVAGTDGARSALSQPVAVTLVAVPPSPPADLRARVTDAGIEVTWGAVTGVSGAVRIYRAEAGIAPRRLTEVPADPAAFVDREARPGVRYFYSAALVVDGVESARSASASARR